MTIQHALRSLPWMLTPRCGICHRNSAEGRLCHACQDELVQLRASADAVYQDNGIASRLIRTAKYGQHRAAVTIASQLWIEDLRTHRWDDIDLVTCVPPAPLRARWRGIHMPLQLATITSRELGVPYQQLLRRSGYRRQRTRSRADRSRNARTQYQVHPSARYGSHARVLLIDDIRTTGATLEACTDLLRRAGYIVDVRTFTTRAVQRGAQRLGPQPLMSSLQIQ